MTDLKEKLLDDLAPRAAFAEAIGVSERTVVRMNLPTTYFGRKPHIIVSKAKAILLGENAKPKRGRPRKVA